jgi:hypothetical protein
MDETLRAESLRDHEMTAVKHSVARFVPSRVKRVGEVMSGACPAAALVPPPAPTTGQALRRLMPR